MTTLFISHDLPTVSTLCPRLAILYRGEIIESGQTTEILTSPQHAYTRHLVAAIPRWPK
jgi:ABC-type oligopeptide transport system ATPase subunit